MSLYLYREIREAAAPPCVTNDSHTGLWFDRFFDRYGDEFKIPDRGKLDWIREVVNGHTCGDRGKLEDYALRQVRLLTALGGQPKTFATDWNFVTGMGLPHPLENGMAWHPTLGVPYLSGAAVKGLVRAWFMNGWAEQDEVTLRRWFGSASADEQSEEAGYYIFFDAVPIASPILAADVITPHMGGWYEKGGKDPLKPDVVPADWHDPVPTPFLVVKKASYLFGIAPRPGRREVDPVITSQDMEHLFEALEQALDWLGAGAKTAVGYGRMKSNGQEQELIEHERARLREEELGELSDNMRLIEEVKTLLDQDRTAKKERPGGNLNGRLTALDKAEAAADLPWSPEERQALGQLMEAVYKHLGGPPAKRKIEIRERITQLKG